MKVINSKENCRKLAKRVVEDMDMDALIEYAEERMVDWYYYHCPMDIFMEDWELNFGGEDVSS